MAFALESQVGSCQHNADLVVVHAAIRGRVLQQRAADVLAEVEAVLRAHLHRQAQAVGAGLAHRDGLRVALVLQAPEHRGECRSLTAGTAANAVGTLSIIEPTAPNVRWPLPRKNNQGYCIFPGDVLVLVAV